MGNLTNYVRQLLFFILLSFLIVSVLFLFFSFLFQVNTIFRQMEEKFSAASDQVMNRMNELGKRIETLETNLTDIISHLPAEQSNTTTQSTTQNSNKS